MLFFFLHWIGGGSGVLDLFYTCLFSVAKYERSILGLLKKHFIWCFPEVFEHGKKDAFTALFEDVQQTFVVIKGKAM